MKKPLFLQQKYSSYLCRSARNGRDEAMTATISGEVTGGNKLGRRLGFPTANLSVDASLPVRDGVYAARVEADGATYDAMANLGFKPSVSDAGRRVLEAHLFGFDGDLYGKTIRVALLDFIRPEERFDSFDALRAALARDKETVKALFRKRGLNT